MKTNLSWCSRSSRSPRTLLNYSLLFPFATGLIQTHNHLCSLSLIFAIPHQLLHLSLRKPNFQPHPTTILLTFQFTTIIIHFTLFQN
ncbi:hypothetical protein MtrunA17_Chr4g0044371 [Medicago truncatula]|uniref:Transmembrane protein n=1 Tax=Medicago truncatula TaxID=3880 RepID=A0A396ID34_MEDTR|nr:hypothetical protein MtrunA17_Chr4g0044371 [Medicago truncatula]